MPKLMVPTKLLVANGTQGTTGHALTKMTQAKTSDGKNLFNWTLTNATQDNWFTSPFRVVGRAGRAGATYVTVKNKKDTVLQNSVTLHLNNKSPWPTGDWTSGPHGELVGQGAACFVVNVVPTVAGVTNPVELGEKSWTVTFTCGEVEMKLQEGGSLNIELNNNRATVQLTEAKAKEVPPQVFSFKEGTAYMIVLYPVWNGVVVSNGIQDVQNNVAVASVYVPKTRDANIMSDTYSPGFDPEDPPSSPFVKILVDDSVKVNFAETVDAVGENCRFELAYVPLFFTGDCHFDTYWIASKDQTSPAIDYSYSLYPIWTDNDTPTAVYGTTQRWPNPDLGDAQEYRRTRWQFNLQNHKPNRRSSEFFGYYLRTRETREFEVDRGNGSFSLSWSGGTPGDPSPSSTWWRYVTNISTTIGLDGSSGSITVDKYGLAGQAAEAIQDIGAVVIDMDGPTGTVAGRIFSGIGMGIGETESSDGGTWTIPLVGLAKKMEDIVLINAPFFDGFKVGDVLEFLCNYTGIRMNLTNAPNSYLDSHRLTASVDLATPVFDWKAGTTIQEALSQVMDDALYWYYIDRNGYAKFYELSETDGLPVYLGPDRGASYTDTKIMTRDLSPDFDDLRNEIVVISMREIEVTGTDINLPLEPLILVSENATTPTFPWSRGYVQGVPGVLTETQLNTILDKAKALSRKYEITGRVTIPGNALVQPYDQWGDNIIISVSHNVDFQAKSWTTDLELASGRS
jgi:hypothetical protein